MTPFPAFRYILFVLSLYTLFFSQQVSCRVHNIPLSSVLPLDRTTFCCQERLFVSTGDINRSCVRWGGSVSTSTKTAVEFLRGGEISLPNQDDEIDGALISTLRNIIRNVLHFGDKKVPILSSILRRLFGTMESLSGLRVLPQKLAKKDKIVKSKSSKAANDSDDGKEEVTKGSKSDKKERKKGKANDLKQPSQATKTHLTTNIKTGNPNYRIQSELKEFIKSPPPNLSVQVGSNIRVWIVSMIGANGTIYEGEVYKLRISFPKEYPSVPPSVYFLKGYIPKHEHVYTNGDICLSLLGKDWRPTMTAQSIAVSILSILSSAQSKALPMDNASHASKKPGEYQKDWVYHDDNC
jgi:ubiquitin-conjugating enzyme E2 W